MKIKTIIGLEIHAQLNSKRKAFCNCSTEYGLEPNTATCPGCLGLPGAYPILNKEVVRLAIMAGLAFNCKISKESTFDRKKYFYPDLAKGYQVTQFETTICRDGYIEVEGEDSQTKKIKIRNIQIEEDTGKAIRGNDGFAYMDFNRSGAPLIEIITDPDINSPKEAKEFLTKLRSTLVHLGVNDGKMEEGSLRCDVNINVVDLETGNKSNIIEIKNIGSFKAVEKTIEFETKRQSELLKEGKTEVRSTRRWDDSLEETILMREKFLADDYRYTRDGDIPNLIIDDNVIEKIKNEMPELIDEKKQRFIREFGISDYEANILTSDIELSKYFESIADEVENKSLLVNFFINDLLRRLNDEEISTKDLKFSKDDFVELLKLVDSDKINNNTAKKVFRVMFEEGIDPQKYVSDNNLIQIADAGAIESIVEKVLTDNPDSIEQYLAGKDRILGFLVGQVMKESKGKANPQIVNKLLLEHIKKHQ